MNSPHVVAFVPSLGSALGQAQGTFQLGVFLKTPTTPRIYHYFPNTPGHRPQDPYTHTHTHTHTAKRPLPPHTLCSPPSAWTPQGSSFPPLILGSHASSTHPVTLRFSIKPLPNSLSPHGSAHKQSACNAGGIGDGAAHSLLGSGRSSGGRHGNPLQYSCLGNPMNRGAWRATVHGVKESTRLSD